MLPDRTGARVPTKCNSEAIVVPAESSIHTMLTLLALTMACLLTIGTQTLAQSPDSPMPENAHARTYGDGWECDPSFRLVEDQCIAIVVPPNAYSTNRQYGAGWECAHGFEEVEGTSCVEVPVPDGGYLDTSGKSWLCTRGYRKIDDICEKIVLPEHAYLSGDTFGSDWDCERGYEKTSDACLAIVVPDNAYLNPARYGQPWTCERGFFETRDSCKAVVVPLNAYYDETSYGPKWKCERGFSATADACKAVIVPVNAHLDRTGNRWDCNRNFQRSKGLCIQGN